MAVTKKVKGAVQAPAQAAYVPFELVLLPLSQVKESPRNTKLHTPGQITDIVRSIKEFGFRDPIAVDENYEIVEGHGRCKALTLMGAATVPALVFKDMSPDQIRAYRITHNQLTLSTGFDIVALASELRDINNSGMDLMVTGFSMGDLESFELQMETKASTSKQESQAEASAASAGHSEGEETVASTKDEVQASTTYQYVMIFDDKAQQQRWNAFVKHMKAEIDGDTVAERLDKYLQSQGF